jgi:hypothetical protein
MSRKLALSLLLLLLGLASFDAVLDHPESTLDEGRARVATDGTPWPR